MLIAENPTVSTRGGMIVQVDHVMCDEYPDLDVLLVPGGFGTIPLSKNQK